MKASWIDKNVVYDYPDGWTIQEVKTPWDLYLEAQILHTEFGHPKHLFTVELGEERIFSLRDEEDWPHVTFLTMPVGARDWWHYGCCRAFNTDSPMTINGEQLILLDATELGQRLVYKPDLLKKSVDFFQHFGGVLDNKYPEGTTLKSKAEIKHWEKLQSWGAKADLLLTYDVNKKAHEFANFIVYNSREAIEAFAWRNIWGKMYLDFPEGYPMSDIWELVSYLNIHHWERPDQVIVTGHPSEVLRDFINKTYTTAPPPRKKRNNGNRIEKALLC